MSKTRVPQFGEWESGGDVPYTEYFDKARKGKSGGKVIKPGIHQDNTDSSDSVQSVQAHFGVSNSDPGVQKQKEKSHASKEDDVQPVQSPPFRVGNSDPGVPKPKDKNRIYKDEGDPRGHVALQPGLDSPHMNPDKPNSGDQRRKPSRTSGGSDHSIERSPLHQHAVKSANNSASGSPYRERKATPEGNHGFGSSTPGRSKLRPIDPLDETLDKGAALPKFGGWEDNPSEADSYTGIFDKVRGEKKGNKAPIITTDPEFTPIHAGRKSSGCSCFGWFTK